MDPVTEILQNFAFQISGFMGLYMAVIKVCAYFQKHTNMCVEAITNCFCRKPAAEWLFSDGQGKLCNPV